MNRYSKRTPRARARRSTGARELPVRPTADRHHHAARFDRIERAEQRVAGLRVEDHVLLGSHRFEAGRLVVDGDVGAERLHQRVVLRAGSGRHVRAEVLGQLDSSSISIRAL
jgi:hypothetical protein